MFPRFVFTLFWEGKFFGGPFEFLGHLTVVRLWIFIQKTTKFIKKLQFYAFLRTLANLILEKFYLI